MTGMNISPNFAFLAQEFGSTAESATLAERHIYGDPRASCFHARHTLEQLVKRVFRLEKRLTPPHVQNFIVRMHLEPVLRFQDRRARDALSDADRETLQDELSTLPSELKADAVESRLFDLLALRMQLANVEHDVGAFEKDRKKAVEIAMALEEKSAIPEVKKQLGYRQAMQDTQFWVGIDLAGLEEMRLRLRDLVTLLDKNKRHLVYNDVNDEIVGVNEDAIIDIPRMTGVEYQRKVEQYLQAYLHDIVIHRLRTNQPLTTSDLQRLETTLATIGEADGDTLLKGMLARSEAPSLAPFVRGLVGMDRAAAQAAFSTLLANQSLTSPQIRFVEMIIEQLTARGVMVPSALYEPPFTGLHAASPESFFAGRNDVIAGLFQAIAATQPVYHLGIGS